MKIKKFLKKVWRAFLLFLLLVVLVNVLAPLFCRKPDENYEESLKQTEFTRETFGSERIRCIDDNEEALLWRLRMIGTAKENIVLSTFDLRADDSGTDLIAALNGAATRGVKIKLLIDGIYQQLFLEKSSAFQTFASNENVEVGIYNPVTPAGLFKLNYRMHDKYLIVDGKMYLLGGRNSNDIFLGDKTTGINVDRDILVYDTSNGDGESLEELEQYFEKIWNESCVRLKRKSIKTQNTMKENTMAENAITENTITEKTSAETKTGAGAKENRKKDEESIKLEERYASLQKKYRDLETYNTWEEDTIPVNKITLVDNGTSAGRKTPQVLQAIRYLSENAHKVTIQTPYVICNSYMYDVLEETANHAQLEILLNAVEKGSNPWGCTDYLNQKRKILKTGADVYEVMNDYAVHTKAVLVDDRISVVGSYNLDMRSTYLDTELMLVIDSKELNSQIRKTENVYMEKSKQVRSDGQETEGPLYKEKTLTWQKKVFYGVLRVVIRPLRQLL